MNEIYTCKCKIYLKHWTKKNKIKKTYIFPWEINTQMINLMVWLKIQINKKFINLLYSLISFV